MKLLIVCIFSWLVGLLAHMGALAALYRESIWSADLSAAAAWSGVAFAFTCITLYLPVLMGMQRLLGGVRSAWLFPFVSTLLFVAPTAFVYFCWGTTPRFTSPEGMLLNIHFCVAGLLLGLGYVRIQRAPQGGPGQ